MRSISFRGGNFNKRKTIKYFVILLVVLGAGLLVRSLFTTAGSSGIQANEQLSLKPMRASKELGKEVQISIKDSNGEEVDKVTMRLENVELRDEIIVKGQKATSVNGRSFLVINLKLSNPLEQGIEINTKDYLRLGEGQEPNDWLAPDIHNDPVLVQAISTKPTRVGFPVNSDSRVFVLQIGEIAGDKEKVQIDLN
jgi:hypothetical protein